MRYKTLYVVLVSFIFLNLVGCGEKIIPLHVDEIPIILEDNKISLLKTGSFIALKDKNEETRFISIMKNFEVYRDAESFSIQVIVSNPEDIIYQIWTKEEFLDDENAILTSGVIRKVTHSKESEGIERYEIELPREPRGKHVRFWLTLRNVKGEALIEMMPITYYLSYAEKGGGFINEVEI